MSYEAGKALRVEKSERRDRRRWNRNLELVIIIQIVLILFEGTRTFISPLIRGYAAFGGESCLLFVALVFTFWKIRKGIGKE